MTKEQFVLEIQKLGIELSEKQLSQLNDYYEMLITWNKVMNLTGITEEKEVYLKHFYDSLTICKILNLKNEKTLCDVGTGAGFPGVVIKICFPHLQVILVDSLQKRLTFLEAVIDKLHLENIKIVHERAEEYAKHIRERYDVVTARAVAPLNILLEYCIPLIKPNKYFIAMKGNISQEMENFDKALDKIGGFILKTESFFLPYEESNRNIILISKSGNTAKQYPRKYSEIKKKPL